MTVVFLTRDLMGVSRVEGAARQANSTLQVVADTSEALEACTAESATLLFVDLSTADVDVAELVGRLRAAGKPPTIVAFGPHVQEARLAAAEQAGCDAVISRGQFMSQIGAIFDRYASESS